MNININVLQKGDEVLSVFNYRDNVAISVKRKRGSVDVVLLDKNVEGTAFTAMLVAKCGKKLIYWGLLETII